MASCASAQRAPLEAPTGLPCFSSRRRAWSSLAAVSVRLNCAEDLDVFGQLAKEHSACHVVGITFDVYDIVALRGGRLLRRHLQRSLKGEGQHRRRSRHHADDFRPALAQAVLIVESQLLQPPRYPLHQG